MRRGVNFVAFQRNLARGCDEASRLDRGLDLDLDPDLDPDPDPNLD